MNMEIALQRIRNIQLFWITKTPNPLTSMNVITNDPLLTWINFNLNAPTNFGSGQVIPIAKAISKSYFIDWLWVEFNTRSWRAHIVLFKWCWYFLFILLDTSRGRGTETCILLILADLGSDLYTLAFILDISALYHMWFRTSAAISKE